MRSSTPLTHFLKRPGFDSLTQGHPWLRASQFQTTGLELLKEVGVLAFGEHWFWVSPQSDIRLRRLGPAHRLWLRDQAPEGTWITSSEAWTARFGTYFENHFAKRLEAKLRSLALAPDESRCLRWIFSENDDFPGLIVDNFGDTLACQILTAPVEYFWKAIQPLLANAYLRVTGKKPHLLELRNAPIRKKEGLELQPTNEATEGRWFQWNGLQWWWTPGEGQKTGAYFDQRDNHQKTAEWAKRFSVDTAWDLCCFEGGFGLHLAKNGIHVLGVDQSQRALDTAKKNQLQNQIPDDCLQWVAHDVFDWLRIEAPQASRRPQMIVLDPPSFMRGGGGKHQHHSALRGYHELNLQCLKQLEPAGLLVSCVCSQRISLEDYRQCLQSAAHDARRQIRILETRGPSSDHAAELQFPEGQYLQCWTLAVD